MISQMGEREKREKRGREKERGRGDGGWGREGGSLGDRATHGRQSRRERERGAEAERREGWSRSTGAGGAPRGAGSPKRKLAAWSPVKLFPAGQGWRGGSLRWEELRLGRRGRPAPRPARGGSAFFRGPGNLPAASCLEVICEGESGRGGAGGGMGGHVRARGGGGLLRCGSAGCFLPG